MKNTSFTRDEIILALDVLYQAKDQKVSVDMPEMNDLSALLQRLPIHPLENRRADFRNITGITRQLMQFRSNCNTGNKNLHVGIAFFNIAFEFEDRFDELHQIATAIRRNEPYYFPGFGNRMEDEGFSEGILLGHLHCLIEVRDGSKLALADHCAICQLQPALIYQSCGGLLQPHLLVPPTEMDGGKKYQDTDFITVCPTCHAALHRLRPWHTKENYSEILR